LDSNGKVNIQHLTEKNRKILDLNNAKFILSEFEEYQVLADQIKKLSQDKKREIKKILIIGEDLIRIYSQLYRISPDAQFYITNRSKKILESFKEHFKNQKNYSTYILDVFKGVSLNDFTYYNDRFDLVIANKIISQVNKKKGNLSIKFLYKHYLRQYGILCIINYTQNLKVDKFRIIRTIKPALEKKIPIKNKKGSIHFIFYIRRKKVI